MLRYPSYPGLLAPAPWLAATLALALGAGGTSWADDPKPAAPQPEDPKQAERDDALDKLNDDLKETEKPATPKPDASDPLDEASRKLRGETEGADDADAQVDPLEILKKVSDKMCEAEDYLAKAGTWKASEAQRKAIEELKKVLRDSKEKQAQAAEDLDRLLRESGSEQAAAAEGIQKLIEENQQKAAEELSKIMKQGSEEQRQAAEELQKIMKESASKQSEAMQQIEKLFKEGQGSMDGAIEQIEKLIKYAKEMSEQQSQSQQKQEKEKPEQAKKDPKNSENSKDPAQKPYTPPDKTPPDAPPSRLPRTPTGAWGNLPPRMREEIQQYRPEDFHPLYARQLERFFKVIAGEGE